MLEFTKHPNGYRVLLVNNDLEKPIIAGYIFKEPSLAYFWFEPNCCLYADELIEIANKLKELNENIL